MSHIVKMTLTSALGLLAVFSVDFVDLFFLSQLEDKNIQAALAYTGTIIFFTISVGIGLAIASSALVARAAGEQDTAKISRLIINSLIYSTLIAAILAVALILTLENILSLLGATEKTLPLAHSYLTILVPTMPLFAISIAASACLRSIGDAMRSMHVTMAGAIVNAILDPIFIFALNLGLEGAAYATAIARFAMVAIGLYGLFKVHKCWCLPETPSLKTDFKPFAKIAVPAILTNIATPIGNGYVTYAASPFGTGAVAAWAVISRLIPFAYAVIFALSGSVGPIIGQNLGGKLFHRVRETVSSALIFNTAYIAIIWLILALTYPLINQVMQLTGDTAELVKYFCLWLSPGFGTIGYLFVANAAFNNLDKPHYSSWLNWARATIGTIPFVYFGAIYAGAEGIFAGYILGGSLTAVLGVYICYDLIEKVRKKGELVAPKEQPTPAF